MGAQVARVSVISQCHTYTLPDNTVITFTLSISNMVIWRGFATGLPSWLIMAAIEDSEASHSITKGMASAM